MLEFHQSSKLQKKPHSINKVTQLLLAVKTFEIQLRDILQQRKAQMHQMEHIRKCSWRTAERERQHSRHTEVLKTRSHGIRFLILCLILPVRFGFVDESIHKLWFQNVKNSCVGKSAQTCWNVSLQSYYYKVCIHNYVMVMLDGHVLTLNVQIHMLWGLLHICISMSSHFKEQQTSQK